MMTGCNIGLLVVILQTVFLTSKLAGVITWSWVLVLAPIIVGMLTYVIFILLLLTIDDEV